MRYYLFLILCALWALSGCRSKVIVYPTPEQEPKSADFEMFVNNKPVFVYQARVSKYPINQVWPGYQRPINQTEIASFAYFDLDGEVEIKINSSKEIKTLDIRPSEYGIKATIEGSLIKIKLSKPMQFSVEVNGYHHALHIFANPVENFNINKEDPKVHYFGPGIHEAGVINVKSNETVFIDGGAIVYGNINSENARNIKILGRGILDASKIERNKALHMINLKKVVNATISGIILRDAHIWALTPTSCDSVTINNIKMIGLWRYNSDGIDIVNCKSVIIRNSFIRAFDDNIVIRGTRGPYNEGYKMIENIAVDSCVLWNDWGRALEIGASTVIDTMKNITFSNCHIPHFTSVAMDIQNCDRGTVKDVHFKNISIEGQISDSLTLGTLPIFTKAWGKIIVLGIYGSFYSSDTTRGHIDHIYFNNIRLQSVNPTGIYHTDYDSTLIKNDVNYFIRDNIYFGNIKANSTKPTCVYLFGSDSTHIVNNIFINNFSHNGTKVTDLLTVGKNEFVKNVFMK
ncbi:MAG: glycosyl hydrolase family 28 protein [Bacteroidetes bacterium]|nr:glycosyl hydrolase family 28 protein [Bacteroidota bacterium]MCL6102117.1 glycosyl hydrolase family 28 protein [Bacteroidota bacterium]